MNTAFLIETHAGDEIDFSLARNKKSIYFGLEDEDAFACTNLSLKDARTLVNALNEIIDRIEA